MSDAEVTITIDARVQADGVAALDRQIGEGMRRLMANMHKRASRLVPKRTRALQRSLRTEVTKEGGYWSGRLIAGGGNVDYALYVEKGTSRTRAQPYLRPALMQTRGVDLRGGA